MTRLWAGLAGTKTMQLPAYEIQVGDVIHGHVGAEPFAHPMRVLVRDYTSMGDVCFTYQRDGAKAYARWFNPNDYLQVTRPAHHTEAGCALVEHAGGWYGIRMEDGHVTTGPWPTLEHARQALERRGRTGMLP